MSKPQLLIKVCGMRSPENIGEVSKLNPDMMGFIFYPASKRFVGGDYITPVNPKYAKVGVFVNEPAGLVISTLKKQNLTFAQLHGSETPETCTVIKSYGYKVIKAFGIDEFFDWDILTPYKSCVDYFLFDTKTPMHGGSGKKFDWSLLNYYKLQVPFLLSGGITPNDCSSLKKFSHPYYAGVDINSGFETEPGIKDITKLEHFIKEFRS